MLPEVLRELYLGRSTGLLHVARGEERVSFRFVNGEVVSGSSTSRTGRLGETMVRHGLLSQQNLVRALVVVHETRRRLGPVLREMGVMDQSRLEEALALHIREMLIAALAWDEATHLFEEQDINDGPTEDVTLRGSTGEVIIEVVRRISRPETVRQGLGDVDRALVGASNPPFRLERITLNPADGYVLSRVDGTASAREIMAITPLPVEDVERSLLGLLCTGVIEYRGPSRAVPPRRGVASARAKEGPVGTDELRTMVERAFDGLATKDHFQVLGLLRTARPVDVTIAHARFRDTFPSDAQGLDPDLASKLQAVLTRIEEAHGVLTSPERRGPYEQSLNGEAHRVANASSSSPADVLAAAEKHLADGRHGEAVSLLESIVAEAQGALEPRVRFLLGRGYMTRPEWARKAETEFLNVIRLDPRDVEARCALGKFYRERSLPERARAMFQKVVELQPGHRTALAELAAMQSPEPQARTLFGKLLRKAQ